MNRIVPLALVAAGLFAVAGAASAAPGREFDVKSAFTTDANARVHQTAVGFSDIDLSSASGARVALARIDRAATAVCGGEPDKADTASEKQDFAACRANAMRSAASRIGAPVLTALIRGQSPTLMAQN